MSEYVGQWPVQEIEFKGTKRTYSAAQLMHRAGPLLPVTVSLPWEREEELRRQGECGTTPVVGTALIDTGANHSGIDGEIVERLTLQPTGEKTPITTTIGQEGAAETYDVRFSFPGTTLPDFPLPRARPFGLSRIQFFIPPGMPGKVIALLGRDFLSHFTFTCEGSTGTFRLLFTGEVALAGENPHS